MNLAIDLGNTQAKVFLFNSTELRRTFLFSRLKPDDLKKIFQRYAIESAIVSSVIENDSTVTSFLKRKCSLVKLDAAIPLPVKMKYKTPVSLGNDRIANAAGAAAMFPKINVLVIDMGTCIKYDFVNAKVEYQGGSISPGLMMRFKALNYFTAQLPLLKPHNIDFFIGQSTKESILTGVQQGIINELNGFSELYSKKYRGLKIVLTGGDAGRFAGAVNFRTFVAPNLIATGLNEILRYNHSIHNL